MADQPDVLQNLWVFEHRHRNYRVRFVDGQELALTALHWGCDIDSAPHAMAEVTEVITSGPQACDVGDALYFAIAEVAEVKDAETGAAIFQAPPPLPPG